MGGCHAEQLQKITKSNYRHAVVCIELWQAATKVASQDQQVVSRQFGKPGLHVEGVRSHDGYRLVIERFPMGEPLGQL